MTLGWTTTILLNVSSIIKNGTDNLSSFFNIKYTECLHQGCPNSVPGAPTLIKHTWSS